MKESCKTCKFCLQYKNMLVCTALPISISNDELKIIPNDLLETYVCKDYSNKKLLESRKC